MPEELAVSGDICRRLAAPSAFEQFFQRFFLLWTQIRIEVGVQLRAANPQDMPQENFALQGSVFDTIFGEDVPGTR